MLIFRNSERGGAGEREGVRDVCLLLRQATQNNRSQRFASYLVFPVRLAACSFASNDNNRTLETAITDFADYQIEEKRPLLLILGNTTL